MSATALTSILSVVAVVLTIMRAWPQFMKLVIKRERAGVSSLTWMMALSNHVLVLMYGVLANVPLFVVVNALAGPGCAAILFVLRSWRYVAVVIVTSTVVALGAYAIADGFLVILYAMNALGMFIPQLVKVFRTSAAGVSVVAWSVAAMASATWIAWSLTIHRPELALAHFLMLPASLVIIAKAGFANIQVSRPLASPRAPID